MLLPLVVLRREGHRLTPPVPAQAWKWLLGWVPTGVVSGGRHARTQGKGRERFPEQGVRGSPDGEEQGHTGWGKESAVK